MRSRCPILAFTMDRNPQYHMLTRQQAFEMSRFLPA
jgi:hypothetical protein